MERSKTTTLNSDSIRIRQMKPSDWENVKSIYEAGIATKNATFDTSAGTWKKWNSDHLTHARLVAENSDQIQGWAALTPVSGRCVYGGVAEVSVYIANDVQGKGLGTALLDRLIGESEQQNIWTLQAGIFPENKASVKLHEKMGFRIVGTREKIGKMDGQWRDVVLMERRSKKVM